MNIGLCKVSSIGKRENSSALYQRNKIGEYCNFLDIELNKVIDECYSGKTSNRGVLSYLRELVNEGKVEIIIVMKLNRLMRPLLRVSSS